MEAAFLFLELAVVLVVLFGSFPSLRPAFNGSPISMNSAIEIIMMSIAALILLVGKADVKKAVMGSTFFEGNKDLIIGAVGGLGYLIIQFL